MTDKDLLKRPCIRPYEASLYDRILTVREYVEDAKEGMWKTPPVYDLGKLSEGYPRIVDREAYDAQMRRRLGLD